jgi:peptidoglycan hydrolase-like protein with peptidoglycan-binding domain
MNTFEFSYPQLQRGAFGTYVKIMQHLLYVRGQALPYYGCDGDFGVETTAAVKRAQQAAGLEQDGVCGIKTWSYLLTGEVKKIESDDSRED